MGGRNSGSSPLECRILVPNPVTDKPQTLHCFRKVRGSYPGKLRTPPVKIPSFRNQTRGKSPLEAVCFSGGKTMSLALIYTLIVSRPNGFLYVVVSCFVYNLLRGCVLPPAISCWILFCLRPTWSGQSTATRTREWRPLSHTSHPHSALN